MIGTLRIVATTSCQWYRLQSWSSFPAGEGSHAIRRRYERRPVPKVSIVREVVETDVQVARYEPLFKVVWGISRMVPALLELRAQGARVELGRPWLPELEPGQVIQVVAVAGAAPVEHAA